MPFCFHSFPHFENRDRTGVGAWVLALLKMALTALQEPPNSRLDPKTCLMSAGQHLPMGWQDPAVVTNWEPQVKAPAELRSYEEDFLFCQCWGSSTLMSSVLTWATAAHQSLPARDATFCSHEMGCSNLSWAPWTSGSSTTHTAGMSAPRELLQRTSWNPHLGFLFFPCPQCQSLFGLFSWQPVPQACCHQSAADILNRGHFTFTFLT